MHITDALARAHIFAPKNDEAQTAPTVLGPSGQKTLDAFASNGNSVKYLATLRAKLALLGYCLFESSAGGYLVSRWDRSRHLNDLHAVAMFLRQVGGVHHGSV